MTAVADSAVANSKLLMNKWEELLGDKTEMTLDISDCKYMMLNSKNQHMKLTFNLSTIANP